MAEAYFQPAPLEKILQSNIPSGMHYAFSLKNMSMTIRFEETIFREAVRWCLDNFAEQYPCEPPRWAGDERYFYRIFFRSATDAAAFKLRWC